MWCQNLNVNGNFASMIVACVQKPAEVILMTVNTEGHYWYNMEWMEAVFTRVISITLIV